MKFKGFILLGLLFAVLLVTSTLAAKTSNEEKKANEVKDTNNAAKSIQVDTEQKDEGKETNQYGRGGRCGRYGCCGYGYRGRCFRCCKNADEAAAAERNELPNGQNLEESDQAINQAAEKYSYGGGYGGYGGGWIGGHGGGYGQGGGPGGGGGYGWGGGGRGGGGYGGGGGRCQYGCCGGYGRYGNCRRCCYSFEEAQSVQNEAMP